MTTWIKKNQAGALLQRHPGSLARYRNDPNIGWIEGIHWTRPNGQEVLYNQELLLDWLANRADPDAHLRAIADYQASLPSNRSRKRKAS